MIGKTWYLWSIVLVSFFSSCSKEKTSLPKPLQEAISQNSNCSCDPYINKYKWRNHVIYLIAYKGPLCNWSPVYFDENGNSYMVPAGYTVDDFFGEAEFIANIWNCGE